MGKLFVVATPIGNLDDISKRAIDTLKEVKLILCEDTRHSLKLLNHYNIKNKLMAYHKFNENEKVDIIIKKLKEENIALITDAGTPCISDPGYILVNECIKNNIEVIGVGGISAFTTALSISGFDLKNFTFYGFFPREKKDKEQLTKEINNSEVEIFVFYESPKRIIKTLEYLNNNFNNLEIVICNDLTKLHEKKYYGKIDAVLKELLNNENNSLGEYTIIIKKELIKKINSSMSIESQLVDIMIKEKVTLKEAINILNVNDSNLSKKDIYNASLNLKDLNK